MRRLGFCRLRDLKLRRRTHRPNLARYYKVRLYRLFGRYMWYKNTVDERIAKLEVEVAQLQAELPVDLYRKGWRLSSHHQGVDHEGDRFSHWCFVKGGAALVGHGVNDAQALSAVRLELARREAEAESAQLRGATP